MKVDHMNIKQKQFPIALTAMGKSIQQTLLSKFIVWCLVWSTLLPAINALISPPYNPSSFTSKQSNFISSISTFRTTTSLSNFKKDHTLLRYQLPIQNNSSSSKQSKSFEVSKMQSAITVRGGNVSKSALKLSPANKESKLEEEQNLNILQYIQIILPLLFVYISNQWSRSSLYYLVDFSDKATSENAMNVALQFSEAQYGALASVAFTALFAIASLLAGNLADKSDRKLLTSISCLAWSVATIFTALAGGYTQVLIARVAMGFACAFATPSAYTLIRDLIPKTRAALASSIYGSGVYFGGALSSLSILLDQNFGWRYALGVISVFGIGSAALTTIFLPEDPSFQKEEKSSTATSTTTSASSSNTSESSPSLISDAQSILSSSQIKLLFLASFLRFSSGLSIAVWAAPYFRLAFPDSASSYALVNAFIVSICGVTSGIVGGALADFVGGKAVEKGSTENFGRMIVPIIGSLLAVPAWYFCVHASSFTESMIWLAVEYLVAECWFGPVVAVLQSSVGKGKGGTAQGMFTLTGAIGNLAPSLLGILYGMQNDLAGAQNDVILSNLLGLFVCGGYFFSAILFALSAQLIEPDMLDAKQA